MPLNDTEEPQNPMVTVTWSPDQLIRMRGDIARAKARRLVYEQSWQTNLNAYAPDPTNTAWGEDINPGVDFYQVEQKKAQLFFDTPFVMLTEEPSSAPAAPQPAAAPAGPGTAQPAPGPAGPPQLPVTSPILQQQEKLNRKLGRRDLDAKRLVDKVLFDVLCPSGTGWSKIGYTAVTKPVQIERPAPYVPLGQAAPAPDMQTVDMPVYEEFFWERFSPMKGLIPTSFHDTEFDKAPWLGEQFTMPLRVGRRLYHLPEDFSPTRKGDEQILVQAGIPKSDEDEEQISGEEIWYKAALFDDDAVHPQQIRQLVFVDGLEEPVVHRDSPHQTFDQQGRLTQDSMIGFPIHPCTVRDLADSSYVPSDCTITRPLVNELSKFRTQLVEQRDASTSVRIANENIITPDVLTKIVRSPLGAILMVSELSAANPPMIELVKPTYPRENFTAQDKIEQDLHKVNAISANQAGAEQGTVRSATELTYVQRNSDVRLQAERNRVLAWFLGGVQKLDALMQRYPDRNAPPSPPLGRYAYDIQPDSGVHIDAAEDLKRFEMLYNLLAKDPNIGRKALHKKLLPLARLDPAEMLVDPPPPGPPPAKTTIVIRGENLSPLSPEYMSIMQILKEEGMKLTAVPITPEMIANDAKQKAMQQPPHPGPATTVKSGGGGGPEPQGGEQHGPHFGGLAGPA